MKRFYETVTVGEEGEAFTILLDGKPVKTPAKAALALPSRELAEAVAAEWSAQGADIAPDAMILTKLANTAIDRVGPRHIDTIGELLRYAGSDLLCYRADAPAELAERQARAWDPWLDWARRSHGAELAVTSGITAIEQPREALVAFEQTLRSRDAFALAGLSMATTILGSLVLALALAEGHLTARNAYEIAALDDRYQAEKWGVDAEAEKRARRLENELESASRFMALARS